MKPMSKRTRTVVDAIKNDPKGTLNYLNPFIADVLAGAVRDGQLIGIPFDDELDSIDRLAGKKPKKNEPTVGDAKRIFGG